MRCLILKKNNQIMPPKNYLYYKLNFFLFKFYIYYLNFSNISFLMRYQFNSLNTIIFQSVFLEKRFLLINDFSSESHNIFNYFLHKDIVIYFKYLNFIYSKSKTKRLFILYFNKIILKKKIDFIFFLNESFFKKNLTFFKKIKILKLGVVSERFNYFNLDYLFVLPCKSVLNQTFFNYYIYSTVRLSYIEKLKNLNVNIIKINL